jgi:mannose-6-phosphate isomerase-like protein (cupin superfamily)
MITRTNLFFPPFTVMPEKTMNLTVLHRDELPRGEGTYEFEGRQYPDTDVSFIWVDMPPGDGVRLHKHPYQEIFVIQEGRATFTVDTTTLEVQAGQIIIVPGGTPHKFINSGTQSLRQIDIHHSQQFITEWLED